MRSEPSMPLDRLSIVPTTPILNRASLSSITFDDRWDEMLHLPVVGRGGNLLGGLSRKSMRAGVHAQHIVEADYEASFLRHLVDALIVTCSGVARLIANSEVSVPQYEAKAASRES
jgi:hypothetical protein